MDRQESTAYNRVAKAIDYIQLHFKEQPSLDQVAAEVNMSPFHFQRLFTDWAGISPKKFIQYLSLTYAKQLISNDRTTMLDTAYATGLSGTGRLHDLFVSIEGMTPGEFKNGGEQLNINYSFADSPFGKLIVASTAKGICHLVFEEDEKRALAELKARFPSATYHQIADQLQQNALFIFQKDWQQLKQIKLHLNGTPFQLKVWESLLTIPEGGLTTYGSLAEKINKPKASRAVGTAIGSNPVAFFIPCHRVIQASGQLGGYRWGTTRKSALIGWEAARLETAMSGE
ncbi:MAG: methylated-DNA--[protein]-cysteine S-methyltransferase [Porticoccaceae bacterium]|nr:methylated-DNA--[protein]-cysteine S-methyltransferase [Pseudomonadales bacterium]MCP5171199.1 methylated-DNA--[protein]-cysteine S-methyltransferase [Pseudomonadales bacterium]MCP5301563.1 methylated-DNA--[protein]-cysteine S-methyltransferase [Pseudomonadales bacterium]